MNLMTHNEALSVLREGDRLFSGVEFTEENFDGLDFSYSIFSFCIFNNVSFKKCKMGKVHFFFCKFNGVDFLNAMLDDIRFHNCIINDSIFSERIHLAKFEQCEIYMTDFSKARISEIVFDMCRLMFTKFYQCVIKNLEMRFCDLKGDPFEKAKIYSVSIKKTDVNLPKCCPEEGEFIAWKKACAFFTKNNYYEPVLVMLRIPADAKRTTFSVKCRADKAEVIKFVDIEGGTHILQEDEIVVPMFYTCTANSIKYIPGEITYADSFDENMVTCSHGIHFFYDREEALNYEP